MKDKKRGWSISLVLVVILAISSLFLVGFKLTQNKTPNEMYAVYLEGKKIGVVKSEDDFNNYINLSLLVGFGVIVYIFLIFALKIINFSQIKQMIKKHKKS